MLGLMVLLAFAAYLLMPVRPLSRPRIALVIVGFALLAVYALHLWIHREVTWRWKEEVQLADGPPIWVDRAQITEFKGGGEPFTSPRGEKAGRIVITDEQGPIAWEYPLAPMILERGIAPARWVVIASPIFCEDHYRFGSPKPPYIQFSYVDGLWLPKQAGSEWYGKKSNLLMPYEQFERLAGQSVSAAQVQKLNDPVYKIGPRYLKVDQNYKSNCR